MVDGIIIDTGDRRDLRGRYSAKETHFFQQVNIGPGIAAVFGSVVGEYQSLSYRDNVLMLIIEIESQRQSMGLIKMVYFRLPVKLFQQSRAPDPQQDRRRNLCLRMRVVQLVANGAGKVVVFLEVGAEQKKGHGIVHLRRQVGRRYP